MPETYAAGAAIPIPAGDTGGGDGSGGGGPTDPEPRDPEDDDTPRPPHGERICVSGEVENGEGTCRAFLSFCVNSETGRIINSDVTLEGDGCDGGDGGGSISALDLVGNPANLVDRSDHDPKGGRPWWAPWALRLLEWLFGGNGDDDSDDNQQPFVCPVLNCNTPRFRHPSPGGGPSQGPAHPRGQSPDPTAGPTTEPPDGPSPIDPEIVEPTVEPTVPTAQDEDSLPGAHVRRLFDRFVGGGGITVSGGGQSGFGGNASFTIGVNGVGFCPAPSAGVGGEFEIAFHNNLPANGFFFAEKAAYAVRLPAKHLQLGAALDIGYNFSADTGWATLEGQLGQYEPQLDLVSLRLTHSLSKDLAGVTRNRRGVRFGGQAEARISAGVCLSLAW